MLKVKQITNEDLVNAVFTLDGVTTRMKVLAWAIDMNDDVVGLCLNSDNELVIASELHNFSKYEYIEDSFPPPPPPTIEANFLPLGE